MRNRTVLSRYHRFCWVKIPTQNSSTAAAPTWLGLELSSTWLWKIIHTFIHVFSAEDGWVKMLLISQDVFHFDHWLMILRTFTHQGWAVNWRFKKLKYIFIWDTIWDTVYINREQRFEFPLSLCNPASLTSPSATLRETQHHHSMLINLLISVQYHIGRYMAVPWMKSQLWHTCNTVLRQGCLFVCELIYSSCKKTKTKTIFFYMSCI